MTDLSAVFAFKCIPNFTICISMAVLPSQHEQLQIGSQLTLSENKILELGLMVCRIDVHRMNFMFLLFRVFSFYLHMTNNVP